MLPAAIMWKIQGSLCSPTEFRLQHIRVPYSNVRVGVKVRRLVEPLVRIKRLLTVLASAELLKVHLQKRKRMSTMAESAKFWPKTIFIVDFEGKNVWVGVKVRRLVEPLVRIKRLLTVLASAELLKVHLQKRKRMSTMARGFRFWPKTMTYFCFRNQQWIYILQMQRTFSQIQDKVENI